MSSDPSTEDLSQTLLRVKGENIVLLRRIEEMEVRRNNEDDFGDLNEAIEAREMSSDPTSTCIDMSTDSCLAKLGEIGRGAKRQLVLYSNISLPRFARNPRGYSRRRISFIAELSPSRQRHRNI